MSAAPADLPDLARWQRVALLVGTVCLAVSLVGFAVPDGRVHFFRAWLVAFCFCCGIALGSLVVLMLQYLTGGEWGYVLRRPLEAATRTLPLVTLFYLPIAFGLPYLYEWANPDAVAENAHLQHKATYLNVPFALTRAAIYFVIWNVLAFVFNTWSRRQDAQRDPTIADRCEGLSALGMVLYVLTITFASIDWVMSLEPEWYSTIYGAMFGMGQVLSAFACAVGMLLLVSDRPEVAAVVTRNHFRDLGSLMLAFVMVWAYLAFSQFLLIWSANLPEEVPWYIYRLQGGWQFLGLALAVFHFALPFVLLLSTDVKRSRQALATVTVLLLVMRAVDLIWLIGPAFHHHDHSVEVPILARFLYPVTVVGLGGLWFGYCLYQLRREPLMAAYRPDAEGATHGAVAQH